MLYCFNVYYTFYQSAINSLIRRKIEKYDVLVLSTKNKMRDIDVILLIEFII